VITSAVAITATFYGEMGTLFSLSKSSTATALDVSELILLCFGAVLVAGLVGEYRESWKRRIKIFEMLVIIGVAGELLADGGIFLFSKRLQTTSDLEVARLNNDAAKLEQRLADRHINLEQREKMLAILKEQPGTRVAVTFLSPAPSDAQEYSIEIGEVFHDANWTMVPFPWLTSMNNPVHGFAVEVREKGSSSKRESLERATRAALSVLDDRISVTHGGHDPGMGMNLDLVVLVGSK
jgi:hypothetical protein